MKNEALNSVHDHAESYYDGAGNNTALCLIHQNRTTISPIVLRFFQ